MSCSLTVLFACVCTVQTHGDVSLDDSEAVTCVTAVGAGGLHGYGIYIATTDLRARAFEQQVSRAVCGTLNTGLCCIPALSSCCAGCCPVVAGRCG